MGKKYETTLNDFFESTNETDQWDGGGSLYIFLLYPGLKFFNLPGVSPGSPIVPWTDTCGNDHTSLYNMYNNRILKI